MNDINTIYDAITKRYSDGSGGGSVRNSFIESNVPASVALSEDNPFYQTELWHNAYTRTQFCELIGLTSTDLDKLLNNECLGFVMREPREDGGNQDGTGQYGGSDEYFRLHEVFHANRALGSEDDPVLNDLYDQFIFYGNDHQLVFWVNEDRTRFAKNYFLLD